MSGWIAQVLALYLSVPEPVGLERVSLWPTERCAQVVQRGVGWLIQYDTTCWERHPEMRRWVVAHELCHAAYDWRETRWDLMSESERRERERRADRCADRIMRSVER